MLVRAQKKAIKLRMSEKIDVRVGCLNDYIQAILPFQHKVLTQIHRFGANWPMLLFRGDKVGCPLVAKISDIVQSNKIKKPITFERERMAAVKHMLAYQYSDWDAMALAQHHEIETRFLDWTSNSLVALYFGLGRHDEPNCHVWILETNERDFEINESERMPIPKGRSGKTVVFAPSMIDSRILAQDSYMMRQVYGHDEEGNFKIKPVEDNHKFRGRLHCLSIDFGNAKEKVREELMQYGYSTESIFPIEVSWDDIRHKCDTLASQYSTVKSMAK